MDGDVHGHSRGWTGGRVGVLLVYIGAGGILFLLFRPRCLFSRPFLRMGAELISAVEVHRRGRRRPQLSVDRPAQGWLHASCRWSGAQRVPQRPERYA